MRRPWPALGCNIIGGGGVKQWNYPPKKVKLQHFMYMLWCVLWTSWPLHCSQILVSNQHTLCNNPLNQRSRDEVGYLGYSKVMSFLLGSEYFSICELFFHFTPFSHACLSCIRKHIFLKCICNAIVSLSVLEHGNSHQKHFHKIPHLQYLQILASTFQFQLKIGQM
jgi:hypothetical protein